jgi:hypothetical protein
MPPEANQWDPKQQPRSDHKSETQLGLERIEAKLRAVQLALEILTGICATLPDPADLEPGVDDDEVEDDVFEDDAAEDNDDNATDETPDDPMALDEQDAIDLDSHQPGRPFLSTILLEPLLALIQPTELSFSAPPSPDAPTTSALGAIHIAAFECLSNAFLALAAAPGSASSSEVQAGRRVWSTVWTVLTGSGGPVKAAPGSTRAAVWDIAVGVLWGVGTVWPGKIVRVLF